jgi:pimeloyl-ACP methyl ester carboxylesterase
LADTAAVMAGASTEAVHRAGRTMMERWQRPTLFVWSHEDPVFPIAHARRYADALPAARIVEIDDCYSFTPEDQPAAVAAAVADFAAG